MDPHDFFGEHIAGRRPEPEVYEQFIEILWNTYNHGIYLYAYGWLKNVEDARDVCQDAFVRAIEWIQKHPGETPATVNFPAWLRRIARNLIIQRFRRPALVRQWPVASTADGTRPEAFADWPDAQTPDPLDAVTLAERIEALRECLDMLPAKRRRMVLLRYMKDLSYDEIASETRTPRNTVGVDLFRAHKQLRECVEFRVAP